MPPALAVRGLTRRFGTLRAVDGVSFEVAAGEVFGLLGPNGAGKTSIVDCTLGLAPPDEGTVEIGGFAAGSRAARSRIGAVLQGCGLQDKITPYEALSLFGTFYPAPLDPEKLIARFGLREKARAAYQTLSGGQKQRLALALAFVGDPAVLVLDEPTTGLDVQMRRDWHEQMRALKAEGRAVLLTTHDMDEAMQLCDRIGVIARGRIVAMGPPRDLMADVRAASLEEVILALTSSPAGPA